MYYQEETHKEDSMTKVNKDRDIYAQYQGAKPLTKAEEFARRWVVLNDKAH
jgi:hypothetical protein